MSAFTNGNHSHIFYPELKFKKKSNYSKLFSLVGKKKDSNKYKNCNLFFNFFKESIPILYRSDIPCGL